MTQISAAIGRLTWLSSIRLSPFTAPGARLPNATPTAMQSTTQTDRKRSKRFIPFPPRAPLTGLPLGGGRFCVLAPFAPLPPRPALTGLPLVRAGQRILGLLERELEKRLGGGRVVDAARLLD